MARGLTKRYASHGIVVPDEKPMFLDAREYLVVSQRRDDATLDAIASVLGLTRERIRQIEFRALRKIAVVGGHSNEPLRPWRWDW